MKDLISIIIPVYNVEKYLKNCLDSVRKQTYEELEIILIDDGSKDSSGLICDEYQKYDSRIRVVHQKNGGLSAARNTGLDLASGKFIAFVDSDDFVHPQFIEILHNNLLENGATISICDYHSFSDQDCVTQEKIETYQTQLFSRDQFILELCAVDHLHRDVTAVVVWNKLYRAELLKNIRFARGKIHEDQFFMTELIPLLEKVNSCHCFLYEYRTREGSLSHQTQTNLKSLGDAVDALELRCEKFENKLDKQIYREIVNYYFNFLAGRYWSLQKVEKNYKECRKFLRKRFSRAFFHYWKYCGAKRYLVFMISPRYFKKIMHW